MVDVSVALGQLPEAHARAIELWSAGASTDTIATQLEVPEEAVVPMLEVGFAKLTSVLRGAVLAVGKTDL